MLFLSMITQGAGESGESHQVRFRCPRSGQHIAIRVKLMRVRISANFFYYNTQVWLYQQVMMNGHLEFQLLMRN